MRKSYLMLIMLFCLISVNSLAESLPLIIKINTEKNDHTITTSADFSYNYDVDWDNDGVYDAMGVTSDIDHNFGNNNTHQTIAIRGEFPWFDGGNVVDVLQWGDIQWKSFKQCFYHNEMIGDFSATDAPNLSEVKDMSGMFKSTNFEGDLSSWDFSNVEDMSHMFWGVSPIHQGIAEWDVSNVKNMCYMFCGGGNLDIDLSKWDVSNVTDMGSMFFGRKNLAIDISQWDVSNVERMKRMFYNCEDINIEFGQWNTVNVTDMSEMFHGCTNFNPTQLQFNTSSVTNMNKMFAGCTSFTADISQWNTSNVTDMSEMFFECTNFNGDLSQWNTSSVTDMSKMFVRCKAFNSDISNWNVSNVTNMSAMFKENTLFNSELNDWDVSKVTDMSEMFNHCSTFNQDIGSWDVYSVKTFENTFSNTKRFNSDIGNWDVRSAESMREMFREAQNFNVDISSWKVFSVTSFSGMFENAPKFDQNLGDWNIQSNCSLWYTFTHISSDNFNKTIIGWGDLYPPRNVTLVSDIPITSYEAYGIINMLRDDYEWETPTGLTINLQDTPYIAEYSSYGEEYTLDFTNTPNDNDYYLQIDWNNDGEIDYKNVTLGVSVDYHQAAESRTIALYGRAKSIINPEDIMDVLAWGNFKFKDLSEAFKDNQHITTFSASDTPDLSEITNLSETFSGSSFVGNISNWDISNVKNMSYMFHECTLPTNAYDDMLEKWSQLDVQENVVFNAGENTTFSNIEARRILTETKNWTIIDGGYEVDESVLVLKTTSTNALTIATNPDLTYNYDIDWDSDGIYDEIGVSTDISHNFSSTKSHRIFIRGEFPHIVDGSMIEDIEQWGNIEWQSMQGTFANNELLESFSATDTPNLSQVTDFSSMFENTSLFNQDLNNWDFSKAENMEAMFKDAASFSKDINSWNVSNVSNMNAMFQNATQFDGDISNWDVSTVSSMVDLFKDRSLSPEVYDAILENWSKLDLQEEVVFHAGELSQYTNAIARHLLITDKQWEITDNGYLPKETTFIFTTASCDEFTLKTNPDLEYNFDIDWNCDGVYDEIEANTDISHSFSSAKSHRIFIKGEFPHLYDGSKIADIQQWGNMQWKSMAHAFANNEILESFSATDTPDLSQVTDMSSMFENTTLFSQDLESWDVSKVTNMSKMFKNSKFNSRIDAWDVSSVNDMSSMFEGNTIFDRAISRWDVDNVVNMEAMFKGATEFDRNIGSWNVSKVTNMAHMFEDATSFNSKIENWNVGKVEYMQYMFHNAESFNGLIKLWRTHSLTNMAYMFCGAKSFDQDMNLWTVRNVTNMNGTFAFAEKYNNSINSWNVSKVTNMDDMFRGATSYSQDMNKWNVSSVTSMNGMFRDATSFDKDISDWNISNVGSMEDMFLGHQIAPAIYENMLTKWSELDLQSNVTFHAGINTTYGTVQAKNAKKKIIDNYTWTIIDGGSTVETIDLARNQEVSIYPNPCMGKVNIALTFMEESNISIYTLDGNMIYQCTHNGNKEIQINLDAGTYLCKVMSNSSVVVEKIIVE